MGIIALNDVACIWRIVRGYSFNLFPGTAGVSPAAAARSLESPALRLGALRAVRLCLTGSPLFCFEAAPLATEAQPREAIERLGKAKPYRTEGGEAGGRLARPR